MPLYETNLLRGQLKAGPGGTVKPTALKFTFVSFKLVFLNRVFGLHYKMQTDYITPKPLGTPRGLLCFPESLDTNQAPTSSWDKIPSGNPSPTSTLEATAPSPGSHTSTLTGPGEAGKPTHIH